MGTKTATKTAPKPEKVSETPVATFNWDSLPEAEIATYTPASPRKIDREESTPAPIKARMVDAFDASAASQSGIVWKMQQCTDVAMAQQFVKLARAYCTFRGWTLRTAATPTKSLVRFAVKPAEKRPRQSSATPATPDKPAF